MRHRLAERVVKNALFVAALGTGLTAGSLAAYAQTFPADAAPRCPVSAATFATWFQTGTPSLNGVVNPANSVNFPGNPNCDFYQWSQQMFYWLTSPAPPTYGGGAHIFDSPSFFDLSPQDATGHRTLLAHSPGFIRIMPLRVAKLGPDLLPITFTKAGTQVQIDRSVTVATGPIPIVNEAGQTVLLSSIRPGPDGTKLLLDANGATITPRLRGSIAPRALLSVPNAPLAGFDGTAAVRPIEPAPSANAPPAVARAEPNLSVERSLVESRTALQALSAQAAAGRISDSPATPIHAHKTIINGNPIFIDPFGSVVDVDQDQADGSVLQARNGSLIYFTIMVNDVWAYFLTGVADGAIQSGTATHTFPNKLSDMTAITNFAATHGKTFADPEALAVEVKASWIEASGLPNPGDYITVQADIPTYNTADPSNFVQTGTHRATLALVGMHVVGSVQNHSEMIWSSFEHLGNAPNEAYHYETAGGGITAVPRDVSGTWLFTATGSTGPFDQAHMTGSSTGITAKTGFTISPSDTLRMKAFGAADDLSPNPLASAARSNSEVISVINSVAALTPAGDVRAKYALIGATWTPPTNQPPSPGVSVLGSPGNQVGTSRLENATLETYDQGQTNLSTGGGAQSNCLSCHGSGSTTVADTFISFMFPITKPLF